MMRALRRSSTGQPERSSFTLLGDLHVGEHVEQLGQRVVVRVAVGELARGAAPVPHQVEATLALLVGDLGQRHDLGGVHDGRIEAGLDALVQEDAVEDVAGGGRQAEAHVRDAERGVHAGQLRLDAPDGLDGGDAVAAEVVVAGRQRERQGVEDQVARLEAVARGGDVVDAMRDPHLPLEVAGLALLVDEQADDRGAVLPGEAGTRGRAASPRGRRPRGWPS